MPSCVLLVLVQYYVQLLRIDLAFVLSINNHYRSKGTTAETVDGLQRKPFIFCSFTWFQRIISFQLLYQTVINLQQEIREIKNILLRNQQTSSRNIYREPVSSRQGSSFTESASPGHIQGEDISELSSVQFEDANESGEKGQSMKEVERNAIVQALASSGGNRSKAAKMLKIGERTLYRKIKSYNLTG